HPCEVVAELHPNVTLRVTSNVPTAHVFVDGQDHGPVGDVSDLAAGPHTVEVRADGYVPFSQQMTLDAGAPREVTATLRRVGPTARAARRAAGGPGSRSSSTSPSRRPCRVMKRRPPTPTRARAATVSAASRSASISVWNTTTTRWGRGACSMQTASSSATTLP